MDDKYEFISAADLPEAEGTDVELLCIENRQLKKRKNKFDADTLYLYCGDWDETYWGYYIYADAERTTLAEYTAVIDAIRAGKAVMLYEGSDEMGEYVAYGNIEGGNDYEALKVYYWYDWSSSLLFLDTDYDALDAAVNTASAQNLDGQSARDRWPARNTITENVATGEVTGNEATPVAD